MKRYHARPLETQAEVDQARNILFEVYHKEIGWHPESENPSGLHVQIGAYGAMLVDKYDDTALWFGCFDRETLVAVHRSHRAIDNNFELDAYKSVPPQFKDSESVELTRLAIRKEYRTVSPAFIVLLAEEFRYLRESGIKYAFGTAIMEGGPGKLYMKAGMEVHDGLTFKYDEADPFEVSLLYYNFKENT